MRQMYVVITFTAETGGGNETTLTDTKAPDVKVLRGPDRTGIRRRRQWP